MIATAYRQKTSAGRVLVRKSARCSGVGHLVADPVVLDVDVLGALIMHWIYGKLSS